MLTNIQKKEFLETTLERMSVDTKSADAQKEIINLLMADTNNGKVYKYRTFNCYALSNLREGTLYCAVPSVFNDPFDCKMGMDFQSLFSARYEKDLEHIDDYFERFIQVYYSKISINDCTDNEQLLFDKWFNSKKVCELVKRYGNADITDAELKQALIANFDVIVELINCISEDSDFKKQMESSKEISLKLLSVMTPEQVSQVVDEKAMPRDYARILGINDDVDEMSLIMRMLQLLKLAQDDWLKMSDEKLTKISRELGEAIDKQFRVGSLSTDYKNRLMWSHYAGSHKGFCVEYDFSAACNELKNITILPVIYSRERIKVPWKVAFPDYSEDEEAKKEAERAMILSILTKDEVWSYENEWRIIVSGACGIKNIKMPPISCIYVGALCSLEDKVALIEIAKELNVPVKQMVVDRGEYTLHAQDCE